MLNLNISGTASSSPVSFQMGVSAANLLQEICLRCVYVQTGIYTLEPPVLKEGTLFKVYINIYTKVISKCTHVC